MELRWCHLAVLASLCLLSCVDARFIVEKGAIQIRFPDAAKRSFPNGFDTSLANFGSPKYGGEVVGTLLYVDKAYGEDFECSPVECKYGCQDFKDADPSFALDTKSGTQYIMLIDRGPQTPGVKPCKFAYKVWNAQQAGAIGVIVVNYDERSTTMEAPDDEDRSLKYLQNITVPAAFVTRSVGEHLKGLIKPTSGHSHPKVIVTLDWTDLLPRNEVVEWEFWSNSNDMCGPVCDVQKAFIKEFRGVAQDFEENKWTRFTPHYLVWVCPDSYQKSDECKSQCIRKGRYCTPDPDGDTTKGYSGRDVVQENLRQLCVYQLANDGGKPWLWWDYVTRFGEECTMAGKTYDEACAEKVFTDIGGEHWSSLGALRKCIGDPDSDRPSDILDKEMIGQRGDDKTGEVYILPTIRINGGQYRGKLSYTEVLRAVCAGFNKNNEPAACNKVGEDDCRVDALGYMDCKDRTDGMTVCRDTFAGYTCECGSGFISHKDAKSGKEECLDINECLATDPSQLSPDCSCERCACQNIYGGYKCIKDLADECAVRHGGCWHQDLYVGSSKQTFSACTDNLAAVKEAAAHGKDIKDMPLHTCECPSGCFIQKGSAAKGITCEPRCDLAQCDMKAGVCAGGTATSSGGMQLWSVLLTSILVAGSLVGAAYAVYQFRIRTAMHQEIRDIMRQYMPLQEADGAPPGAGGVDGGH